MNADPIGQHFAARHIPVIVIVGSETAELR